MQDVPGVLGAQYLSSLLSVWPFGYNDDLGAGLNALLAARAFGATKVAITDVRTDNLPLAEKMGAKYALHTPISMSNAEAAALLKSCMPPDGPDCIIDCAGYESTMRVMPCWLC